MAILYEPISQAQSDGHGFLFGTLCEAPSEHSPQPCQLFCETTSCTEGYLSERNTLWDSQGRLLVEAQQQNRRHSVIHLNQR